jgi:hypothetical protein
MYLYTQRVEMSKTCRAEGTTFWSRPGEVPPPHE